MVGLPFFLFFFFDRNAWWLQDACVVCRCLCAVSWSTNSLVADELRPYTAVSTRRACVRPAARGVRRAACQWLCSLFVFVVCGGLFFCVCRHLVVLRSRHAHDLQVRDHVTPNTQFPLIISRMERSDADAAEPLMGLQMAMPPLDGSSSLSLRVRGRPLQVVANLPFLLGLSDFFAVQPVNLHAIEDAMINALGNARQQSSAAIADALDAHKSLNIDIVWLAPKVVK